MTKSEMYNYLNKNKMRFLGLHKGSYDEKLDNFIKDKSLDIPVFGAQNIFDYLTNDKGKFCKCGKINFFIRFSEGYRKNCSKKCLYKWRSDNMIGENNNIHKASEETLKAMGRKTSIRIKKSIENGTFTPCVTNSWAKSRCIVNINRKNTKIQIKCRSSWEAYFQIKNPNFLYEKIRIPYFIDGNFRNYIVDFVDLENKTIFEIKPSALEDSQINLIKFKAAKDWSILNNYKFEIVNTQWFIDNYNENLLVDQPDEIKIKRLLKQFAK